jgi:predicted nucleotidyltransferase component of viral defense system
MIELIHQQLKDNVAESQKLNRLREFLQFAALKTLYDNGYFNKIAFVGGTALRVLFDLRRFSEDLDFSLVNKKGYDFKKLNSIIQRQFKLWGLDVETKAKEEKTGQNTLLKFKGLLKELGLSQLDEQKLSIKIEVDTNPPKGWHLNTTLVNKVYLINITHFDLPSLYATKLHACFFRKYAKGRDFYDLAWYIARKAEPNFTLLNNAIKQTEGKDPSLNKDNFHEFLLNKLKKIDFREIKKDVERFLEERKELELLELKVFENSLKNTRY